MDNSRNSSEVTWWSAITVGKLTRKTKFRYMINTNRKTISPASPQHGDLRLSGPPSGQSVSDGTRTRYIGAPADLKEDSLSAVPRTPP
ncbi:hypothetical protein PoB_003741900 [Plakobranchus ocellatus]|uniref:Uncharacterized protein n=1 Tax=Plakobranchus ocellatus TaxID=259542 RepID=A0AAV4AWZ3_9GAST|nr:hypothetical protein PoB_003741900 [Plakobranchus ocellatus]